MIDTKKYYSFVTYNNVFCRMNVTLKTDTYLNKVQLYFKVQQEIMNDFSGKKYIAQNANNFKSYIFNYILLYTMWVYYIP